MKNLLWLSLLLGSLGLITPAQAWAENLSPGLGKSSVSAVDSGSGSDSADSSGSAEQDDFDRLDGTGTSGKTVHVVSWHGIQMELQIEPAGSLRGLSLVLDSSDS